MEAGKCVVLLNLENLYESLYDALNQYYVYLGDQQFVDLGLGTQRVKCRVHKQFRLIVVAEKNVVYEKFPIPLINRLEKHILSTKTMLSKAQIKLSSRLQEWARKFATVQNVEPAMSKNKIPQVEDVFIGYHPEAAASIVLQVCKMLNVTFLDDSDDQSTLFDRVYEEAQDVLLRCATPESVVRLQKSLLAMDAESLHWRYFMEQRHDRLQDLLETELNERTSKDIAVFLQVCCTQCMEIL